MVDPSQFFFLHVMKTAGSTFREAFSRILPAGDVWPPTSPDDPSRDEESERSTITRYLSLDSLAQMIGTGERPRFVSGHYPYAARALLQAASTAGDDVVCMTMLREPVARTLSFLAHTRRHSVGLRDRSDEEIYEDPWWFDRFVHNHQTRLFSITLDEATAPRSDQLFLAEVIRAMAALSDTGPRERAAVEAVIGDGRFGPQTAATLVEDLERLGIDMSLRAEQDRRLRAEGRHQVPDAGMPYLYADAAMTRASSTGPTRFATAVENLRRCEVVGTTEDYEGFVRDVNRTFGLECSSHGWRNAGERSTGRSSAAFRRRIEEDNRTDMELYEAARTLIEARRRDDDRPR